MPTEISFSGGLTFRISDSSGNVKFDINNKQPKIVQKEFKAHYVSDVFTQFYNYQDNIAQWPNYNMFYSSIMLVNHINGYGYIYTNVSPTDGFILPFIQFPTNYLGSGLTVNNTLKVTGTGTNPTIANNSNNFLFRDTLDTWIPANGGKLIRVMFTPASQGWAGGSIFSYNWIANPYSNSGTYAYVIQYGIQNAWVAQAGNRQTNTNSSQDINYNGQPALYNMKDLNGNTFNLNSNGTIGTASVRMTHCHYHAVFFICT